MGQDLTLFKDSEQRALEREVNKEGDARCKVLDRRAAESGGRTSWARETTSDPCSQVQGRSEETMN